MDTHNGTMSEICLKNDNGANFTFTGRLFSECSWFDEEYGVQTRQKLYITENNEQVYYIIRSGSESYRKVYRLTCHENICTIHDGNISITLSCDMLKVAVQSLCGLDTAAISEVEETLRAVNA